MMDTEHQVGDWANDRAGLSDRMSRIEESVNLLTAIFPDRQVQCLMSISKEQRMTKKLDLNTLNETDLERIPGIGKEHAKDIINYRSKNGLFKDWNDLKKVQGFTDDMVDNLKLDGVSLSKSA
jgi:competence ComEA-like helix-hairpin-helix protein